MIWRTSSKRKTRLIWLFVQTYCINQCNLRRVEGLIRKDQWKRFNRSFCRKRIGTLIQFSRRYFKIFFHQMEAISFKIDKMFTFYGKINQYSKENLLCIFEFWASSAVALHNPKSKRLKLLYVLSRFAFFSFQNYLIFLFILVHKNF